jgi:hypothetical protein
MLLTLLTATALAQSAPVERRLYADRVDASSFLWNDWNRFQENYHPNYVMDGDPSTAWVEGAATDGVGEWLRVPVSTLEGATTVRLRVRNGYQKSSNLFKANARAKQVDVKLLPSGVTASATLTDAEGWQELTFNQPAGKLDAIEVRVRSTYAGSKYKDLCISDLEVYATAATRDNPAAEKAKMDNMLTWKASRVAAAKMFATSTREQMPLAPAYRLEVAKDRPAVGMECDRDPFCSSKLAIEALQRWPRTDGLPNLDASLLVARTAYATRFAGWTPVQAVAKDTRPIPPIEGLAAAFLWNCFYEPAVYTYDGSVSGTVELPVNGTLGLLRASTVGTFAVANPPGLDAVLDASAAGCKADGSKPTVAAWAQMAPANEAGPASVKALLLAACGQVEDREGTTGVGAAQLLVYDDVGQLQLLVGPRYATAFSWKDGMISEGWRVAQFSDAVHMVASKPTP